jgi:regulator of replication initiation timing
MYYRDLTEYTLEITQERDDLQQRVRELEAEVDDLKNLLEAEIEENEMLWKELKELKGMV